MNALDNALIRVAGRVNCDQLAGNGDAVACVAVALPLMRTERIARRFDIAVVGQARHEQGASEELMIEGALFGSGRPLIVVPHTHRQGLKLDRIIICWAGSRPA